MESFGLWELAGPIENQVLHQFHCDFSLSLGKSGFSKIPF